VDTASDTAGDTERGRRRVPVGLVALVLAPAVVLLLVALTSALRTEVIVVEVPLGTAALIDAGEPVELLPRTLEVSVGDTLEIHNLDVVAHEVGPYGVAAGQTLRQTFSSPGTLQGLCTLHPDGELTIVVR
jgi:plastocyanin